MRYCWLKSSTLFKCSPQPNASCYCLLLLLLLFSGQQAENPKNPGKTRKYLGFPGIFGYYPHWTLEIVVGHW